MLVNVELHQFARNLIHDEQLKESFPIVGNFLVLSDQLVYPFVW